MATLTESQLAQLERAAADVATIAAVGPFEADKLHLYQALIAVAPGTPLATFTAAAATFTGYAATAIVWDVPTVSADGVVEVVSVPIVFRPTDGVTPNNIWGVYVTNTGSSEWHFAGQVDGAPVPLEDALSQLIVTLRYRPASQSLVVTIE